jgi:HSP20 family protein
MFLTTRNSNHEISNRISRLLSDALGGGGLDWQYRDSVSAAWVPPVDIFEDKDAIRITAEVPGVRPQDVKISLEGNTLTVHGQKLQEAEQQSERVHRYERTYGEFERTFSLPTSVDAGKISASYEHGILTITLPKAEQARPRQIQVEVTQK